MYADFENRVLCTGVGLSKTTMEMGVLRVQRSANGGRCMAPLASEANYTRSYVWVDVIWLIVASPIGPFALNLAD